jgi:hypothetical protein
MADPSSEDLGPERTPEADRDGSSDSDYALEVRRREERRAVEEAGGGESEGFEQSEQELIEHTSHGDDHATSRITRDAASESDADEAAYGEADEEHLPD